MPERSAVEMDGNELAACYWALDFYLAAAGGLASRHMKAELLGGAERAQAIVQAALSVRASEGRS